MNDRDFLLELEAAAIPPERWKHRDHVRAAYLYLCALPFADAVDRLCSSIQSLNRAHGVLDTPGFGYHETLTLAWASVVAHAIARSDRAPDFATFAEANPSLFEKETLLAHYSRERLLSLEARSYFVEPDIAPLPNLGAAPKRPSH